VALDRYSQKGNRKELDVMGERINFHFDPLCPWAWQGSRWIREVQRVRHLDVEWKLFSLKLVNEGREDPLADEHVKGTPALRTLALTKRQGGNESMGRLYEALGTRIHERGEEMAPDIVRASLADVGLEPDLVQQAMDDDSTMADVRAEHDAAVSEAGCFGVPTIVTSSGKGIFGPVLATAPQGAEAGELWDRVLWLIEQDTFFELKRDRDRKPSSVA
jgi:2-hydroxychromene-2-carboxylate isomerase